MLWKCCVEYIHWFSGDDIRPLGRTDIPYIDSYQGIGNTQKAGDTRAIYDKWTSPNMVLHTHSATIRALKWHHMAVTG